MGHTGYVLIPQVATSCNTSQDLSTLGVPQAVRNPDDETPVSVAVSIEIMITSVPLPLAALFDTVPSTY
jgi:hypothetical protein